ncbi:MAG: non-canonical purine NTP diphosphatase [Thermonemataceae bacterium]|nr:non-canonical purine NTP diphosphatase [Thermonemataceae bacterium]
MKICFATNNTHKIQEVQAMLPKDIELLSLSEIGCNEELAEEQSTIEGNSAQKAQYIWQKYQVACFADDSGLEVEALNNAPGVYSARYAGKQRDDAANIALLLQNLAEKISKKARFRTCITLILPQGEWQFEGIIEGNIVAQPRGLNGFGYDPVFQPLGYEKTFAEMEAITKNNISHRALAIKKLVDFLTNL